MTDRHSKALTLSHLWVWTVCVRHSTQVVRTPMAPTPLICNSQRLCLATKSRTSPSMAAIVCDQALRSEINRCRKIDQFSFRKLSKQQHINSSYLVQGISKANNSYLFACPMGIHRSFSIKQRLRFIRVAKLRKTLTKRSNCATSTSSMWTQETASRTRSLSLANRPHNSTPIDRWL